MALHKNFPSSPHVILKPEMRWIPSDNLLRESSYGKLLPPLVHKLRKVVYEWREQKYAGASETSKALLNWWFKTEHVQETGGGLDYFRYYFAQREAVETVIYLYDVAKIKSPQDLMKFDSSGAISHKMFDEDWRRFVIKMATGSGKTKVLSLLLAWSYFHRLYEPYSGLSKNFLLIAPNIIVLDRLRADFDGLKIFHKDPVIPINGYNERNWKTDFQLTLHIQDQLQQINPKGNIFLTNIHRVYSGNDTVPSFEDENREEYFLGPTPVAKTTDSKTDLGDIVRNIDELVVFNDEAHHIHDKKLAWFDAIQEISNKLKMKNNFLSLQLDVTATPRHNNGAIFVQTISDYPLVEAVAQNVVKHPILPNKESRDKLQEKKSIRFTEQYEDYIHLGVVEWKKTYNENIKLGKKSILFIMTDDTASCDDVAEYLEKTYPDLKGSVLSIHTNKRGDILENTKTSKSKEELERLRLQANTIDSSENPYKAIVSVLVLKEGWDVKNVTTIVGLRAFAAESDILPEQTLGRGLRLMYQDTSGIQEKVGVIGTDAFIEFVENIQKEGLKLEYKDMGEKTLPKAPLIVAVDSENPAKDIFKLDISIPTLTPRSYREYKNLSALDVSKFQFEKQNIKTFPSSKVRRIDFKYMVSKNTDDKEDKEDYSHSVFLTNSELADYENVIGFFARTIRKELRLLSGYYILYEKVKEFTQNHLFQKPVDLTHKDTIKNLSEPNVTRLIIDTFKKEINRLTLRDREEASVKDTPKGLINTRPFVIKEQGFLIPKKSLFNKIVGDNNLELEFAQFLDSCEDIVSYTKNYFAVGFKMDYVDHEGHLRDYFPDFLVKKSRSECYIVETKGREDLNDPLKMKRLKTFCSDVSQLGYSNKWGFVFVDEKGFKKYRPKNFQSLLETFKKYQ